MSKRRKPAPIVQPGDYVLIGRAGITMPSDWFFAVVEWTDGEDVLVTQWGLGGNEGFKHLHSVETIRAIGDIGFLREFQLSAKAWVRDRQKRVAALEQALGVARSAVWSKLDEIGASRPTRGKSAGIVAAAA